MTLDIKELDFNVEDNTVRIDLEILLGMLNQVKDIVDDFETRIATLEGP